MPSRIFSIVEVAAKESSYVIVNGQWWELKYDPGAAPHHDSDPVMDYEGVEPEEYVWPLETRKMSDVSIKSYRLKVSMAHKDDTDYVERDIAKYILLEEKNELLKFERLD